MANTKRNETKQLEDVPKSLRKALAVLEMVAASDEALSTLRIAQQLDLPTSTVSRLAIALVSLGYLEQSPVTLHFSLGHAALRLSLMKLSRLDLRSVASPMMRALSEETGFTVDLGMPVEDEMIYVELAKKFGQMVVATELGYRMPMETTAGGHAALAAMPQDQRQQTLRFLQTRKQDEWARILPLIMNSLNEVEQRGFCLVDRTWRPDVVAIGVPFSDPRNGRIYGFSCSVVGSEPSYGDVLSAIGPRFVAIVADLHRALGGS